MQRRDCTMSEINQNTAVAVAQAITAKVAAIEGASCAVLDLVPEFDLQQVSALQIIVSPQSYTRGNKGSADRGAPDSSVKVSIAIMRKCANKSEIPTMLTLSEKIARGIERQTLTNSIGIVSQIEFDPLYDMQIFRRMKVFIAVCTATIKVIR